MGLHALQHRGQEGCGIVSYDGKNFHQKKDKVSLVIILQNTDVIKNFLENLQLDTIDIPTTGETSLRNIQPFFADLHMGGLSIAHNGNLTNALILREGLVKDGAILELQAIQKQSFN